MLEEQLSSGKRINRPSDDPTGTVAVLKLRTSQTEIKQFQRAALASNQKLVAADDTLTGYENLLERVRTLVSQGMSDTTPQSGKNAVATELTTLRQRILNVANGRYGDEYIFGGTRQNHPPYDPTTAVPSGYGTIEQYVQVEPGASAIQVSVIAEKVFADPGGNIFADLDSTIAALRGTGNPAADATTLQNSMARLAIYKDVVNVAHARIGASMNATEGAMDNLGNNFVSLDQRANEIEDADFAQTATEITQTQVTLDATLKLAAQQRRSLFDYL